MVSGSSQIGTQSSEERSNQPTGSPTVLVGTREYADKIFLYDQISFSLVQTLVISVVYRL